MKKINKNDIISRYFYLDGNGWLKNMRMRPELFVCVFMLLTSCGGGGANTGGEKPQDPNLVEDPQERNEICEKNWDIFLTKMPIGLTLKYEHQPFYSSMYLSTETITQVEAEKIEKQHLSIGQKHTQKIERTDFIKRCATGWGSGSLLHTWLIKETKDVVKSVRAGKFNTTQIQTQTDLYADGASSKLINEYWISNDGSQFIVAQTNKLIQNTSTLTSSIELVSIKYPE